MQQYLSIDECNLAEFSKSLDRELQENEVPLSHDIINNVPIYDVSKINFLSDNKSLRTEWANVLHKSAGVFVLKNAYPDTSIIDTATVPASLWPLKVTGALEKLTFSFFQFTEKKMSMFKTHMAALPVRFRATWLHFAFQLSS